MLHQGEIVSVFDLEKDDLLRLSDTQLEELVARLAEADVASHGLSPASVSWSGSINAPDAGIDIHVEAPVEVLSTGFLQRPDTVLQAKKHSMPRSAISDEMVADGELSPTISAQAAKSGSYIIVSLADDCSPLARRKRLDAMREAVQRDPNSNSIHLDFFDRSKLLQWLRQHPSVMLWTKGVLGQGYSGWRPYGAWSNPPQGAVDTLISAPGVTISLPAGKGEGLTIENAIEPMRELIQSTTKAVRITGLSGVGKTRIVQALFDETVGTNALDRTIAVYVDTGLDPNPSATAMLDRLIAEGRRAIMVLDNCPSELHSSLASKVSAADGEVSLITVEYDIKDDKPQTTEVIHIEAVGTEVAEQLLIRRFPRLGQNNAYRIAEFADGNARVALAIAERVEEGESLAQLSDTQLFNRLFEQRNQPDDHLREHAEVLSLVYSFSVAVPEVGQNELEVLGSISGHPHSQLFRSVSKLAARHVVQKRGQWRAILPHAIANKLAGSALHSNPVESLRAVFEAPGRQRLLLSFAHRLGLLHDHPVAKEIVETWLQPDGLLGQVLELDDAGARMLDYIGPVAPETLLDRIEAELTAPTFQGLEARYNPRRTTILNLLQSLAYESTAFDRCIRLLIRVADYEEESNNYDAVRDKITKLFQPYLSGTHASLNQRIAVIEECVMSELAGRRLLGFKMLSTALDGPPWTGFGRNEFGARPRDFGYRPTYEQLAEWRSAFIDLAVRLGTSGDPRLEDRARLIMANEFRGMWYQEAMHGKLVDAARRLHAHKPWGEGWKAIRSTIHFDYSKRKDGEEPETLPTELATLERELEPKGLVPEIMTYVLSNGYDYWALDAEFDNGDANRFEEARKRMEARAVQLGENFAASSHELSELGPGLFSRDGMPYRAAFGRGLAKSALDLRIGWQKLKERLDQSSEANKDFAIFAGFIELVDSNVPALAKELLDQCVDHGELRQVLVGLHPRRQFTEADLDRCLALLDDPDTYPWMYGPILWRDDYADLPDRRIVDLAQRMLTKMHGDNVVLDALSMKLHGKDDTSDTLGPELRLVGLKAAIHRIGRDQNDSGGSIDHDMEQVVSAALRFDGNEGEKRLLLDTIVSLIDDHYGFINAFDVTIETAAGLMPNEFLDRIFDGTNEERRRRDFCIRHGGSRRSPLTKINVETLIDWCQTKDDPNVWNLIASGIVLWQRNEDQNSAVISDTAIQFLEASPNPEAVLAIYAERVEPSSWSGSRANIMQPRADAISGLVGHGSAKIADAAKVVSQELATLIERQRVRERHQDEEREQKFE
jgi:hypothetical protein